MLHFWSVMCVVSHSCHAWYIIENEIVWLLGVKTFSVIFAIKRLTVD
jgi:hypothetical protein